MKKKFLAMLLTLAMLVSLVPTMAFASEAPGFTPVQYGTGDTAYVEDLHPGDTLSAGVTFDTEFAPDVLDLTTKQVFEVYSDLTAYYASELSDFYTTDELTAAFGSGQAFEGKTLMVVSSIIEIGNITLVPVFTEEVDHYGVWVDGTLITASNASDVLIGTANEGTVSYDKDSHTLTLNGANITATAKVAIMSWLPDLTIELVGENNITYTADEDNLFHDAYAEEYLGDVSLIAVPFGNLTITGTDTDDELNLELNMDDCSWENDILIGSHVVSRSMVNVQGGYCDYFDEVKEDFEYTTLCGGDLEIKNVTVDIDCPLSQYFDDVGNSIDEEEWEDDWCDTGTRWNIDLDGICAEGDMLIQDAKVSVEVEEDGICCAEDGDMDIVNSEVIVTSYNGVGIDCEYGDLTITESKLNITAQDGYGIYCEYGDMTVTKSKLDVTANDDSGLMCNGSLKIEDCVADGGDAAITVTTSDAVSIYAINVDITDSTVTAAGLCGFSGNSLTVAGRKSVVKGIAERYGLYLVPAEDEEEPIAPSLNVTDGLVQFTGEQVGIFIVTEDGEYDLNGLTFSGSTTYNDFDHATEPVTWYEGSGCITSMIGTDPARSVQFPANVEHDLTVSRALGWAIEGCDYEWDGNTLIIKSNGLTVSGTTETENIVVANCVSNLTLNNVDITGSDESLICAEKDLKIVLVGENTLNQQSYGEPAIYMYESDLEITGNGSLDLDSHFHGIYCYSGSLTISGKCDVDAATDSTDWMCPSALNGEFGVTITTSGDVTATSESGSAIFAGGEWATGDVMISGKGYVTAQSNSEYAAIYATDDMTLNTEGIIRATNNGSGAGIGCDGALTIGANTGKIVARGYCGGEYGAIELYGSDALDIAEGLAVCGSTNINKLEAEIDDEVEYEYVDGEWEAYSLFVEGELAQAVLIESLCTYDKPETVQDGTFNLKLGGCDKGEFTFEPVGGGWSIKEAEDGGKYLAMADGKLVLRDASFAWSYKNGAFSTVARTLQQTSGRWVLFLYIPGSTKTVETTYYLNTVEDGAKLSTLPVSTELYTHMSNEAHEFGAEWTDCLDGKHHQHVCINCGKVEKEVHSYDSGCSDHYCVCGAYDPDCYDVEFTITEGTKKQLKYVGIFPFGYYKKVQTYTANIDADGVGTDVCMVQYQLNGSCLWTTGTSVSSSSPITSLKVRALGSDGKWYYPEAKYTVTITTEEGTITPNGGTAGTSFTIVVPSGTEYCAAETGLLTIGDKTYTPLASENHWKNNINGHLEDDIFYTVTSNLTITYDEPK